MRRGQPRTKPRNDKVIPRLRGWEFPSEHFTAKEIREREQMFAQARKLAAKGRAG
jgi:hypothetical protein